ncbi:MAG: hypothetical protein ACJ8OJ_09300 [Povalibacter sp.]
MRLLSCLLLFSATQVLADSSAFRFDASRVPVGQVFHYVKSNLDGSHEGQISVYMLDQSQVESLKWDPGAQSATLVTAAMDWTRFSVRRFEAYQLSSGSPPKLRATLEASPDGSQLRASFKEAPVQISHWPWHSYDFDFTSLNLSIPHWRNTRGTMTFWRTDYIYSEPADFREVGAIELKYERTEEHRGQRANRYSIGGQGLDAQYGTWWSDANSGLLIEYELPIADEPGYENVRLRLRASERMSPSQWDEFKRAAVNGKPASDAH